MNTEDVTIPHDWVLPKDYYHQFRYDDGDVWMRFTVDGKTDTIHFEQGGGVPRKPAMVFAWMRDCVAKTRIETDKKFQDYVKVMRIKDAIQ